MRTGTPPMWMWARSSGMEDDDTVPVAMPYREALPEGDEKVRAVRSMFDAIAPRYDMVNRIMTFRMDVGWRRRTVQSLELAPGSTVVDFGTIVPRIGAALSDADASRYLPQSVASLPPTDELMAMVREAGFANAKRSTFSGGIAQLITGTRA